MIAYYEARNGREAILRLGPMDASPLMILPPLFEEANRTRAFLLAVMRRLAAAGIATALPDLPGCNDSPIAMVEARLDSWNDAVAALVATLRPRAVASLRGGALLDAPGAALPRWRLSPQSGARVLRDMVRSTAMGSGIKPGVLEIEARSRPTRLAGNLVHHELYAELEAATVASDASEMRTVRLTGDAGEADAWLDGSPIWRRAEPGSDPVLVETVVADLSGWLA